MKEREKMRKNDKKWEKRLKNKMIMANSIFMIFNFLIKYLNLVLWYKLRGIFDFYIRF